MNTLVNFELAKLLKEKEFDGESFQFYEEDGELLYSDGNVQFKTPYYVKNIPHLNYFIAPTIAEVVMWLYEKHNIIVESCWEGTREIDSFDARIIILGKTILSKEYKDFKLNIDTSSPTEAYEAAIEYTLTKLI